MELQDGTGSGYKLKINKLNRAETDSVVRTEQREASSKGNAFQIGTGPLVLTSANESAVLFIKNNEDLDLKISAVNVTSNAMTGASTNTFMVKLYLLGTALSAGVASAALNNNFGSSNALVADIAVGGEAQTVTNGVASGAFYIPSDTFFHTELAWTLPKGISVALSITPAASNTSFPVTVTLEGHIGNGGSEVI